MITALLIRACDDAANEVMPALLAPLGFSIRRYVDRAYVAESERVQIMVVTGYTTVYITVLPLWDGFELHSNWHDPMDSYLVLRALAPDVDESDSYPRPVRCEADVKLEMQRQLGNLISFCRPLLDGDKGAWTALDSWKLSWGGLFRGDDEAKDDYVVRLRELASDAWQKRQYWRLSSLYSQIGDFTWLTLRERCRQFSAWRHTFLIG